MSGRIRVLYVDDDPTSRQIRAELLTAFEGMDISTAGGASEGLKKLETHKVDCILCDLKKAGINGLDFLDSVRTEFPDLPFILFTTTQPRSTIEEALDADVTDYIVKRDIDGFQDVLVNRIRQYVSHYRTKQQLEAIERRPDGESTSTDSTR